MTNELSIPGIHHVTAIASDPQRNVDFYTRVLGLRLVKVTVNYDDPGSYHFYYGDDSGRPGTIMTFFAWPDGRPGRIGAAQATTTAFAVPEGSLDFWQSHLKSNQVEYRVATERSGGWAERSLLFHDPDGLQLELVEHAQTVSNSDASGWPGRSVPQDAAIRGFHSVALTLRSSQPTEELLQRTMGFKIVQTSADRIRYEAVQGSSVARYIDLLPQPGAVPGRVAVGSVHHVAWRTADDAQQERWLTKLIEEHHQVSPVMDRQYFHSIYFREPGGVLFEIATDGPGFTADEPWETLGSRLCLPGWMEKHRPQIELVLPPIREIALQS